ncbi:MAG: LCP family protein [Longicatena sp.]
MKKESKRARSRGIQLDFLLVLMLLILGIALLYSGFTWKAIPTMWMFVIAIVYILLFLILTVAIFVKQSTWIRVVRRVFILILCAGVGIGCIYIQKAKEAIDKIASPANTEEEIIILIRNQSKITKVADLANKSVGLQNGTDKTNASYAKKKLNQTANSIKYVEDDDYMVLLEDLMVGNIDAVAISYNRYKIASDSMEKLAKNTKTLTTYSYQRKAINGADDKDINKDVFTFYITGIDEVGDPNLNLHSDVNILLIVEPKAQNITMVSIPRDGFIPNYEADNENDKLTHTGMYSLDDVLKSVENYLDIPIDYYGKISFSSVISIVNKLGGIEVDVPIAFCEQDENRSFEQDDLICLNNGVQTVNGKQALAFARHRHSYVNQDLGRNQAQQQVMKGMMKKAMSLSGLSKLDSLLDTVSKYVSTNVSSDQIGSFASNQLQSSKNWTIQSIYLNKGSFDTRLTASIANYPQDVYLFSRMEIQQILDAYQGANNRGKMRSFSFDLQDLYANSIPLNDDSNIVWADQAVNPH